jgi:mRNA interferase MazF
VDLGEVPEVRGHEQAKTRPCIVVKSFSNLKLAIVLPVTGSTKLSFYTIVPLAQGTGGLTKDSYVLCHQIRTISFDRVTRSVGKLDKRDFLKIQSVLSDTLGTL